MFAASLALFSNIHVCFIKKTHFIFTIIVISILFGNIAKEMITMSNKTVIKIMIDIVMTILFIVLIDAFGTGLVFHEIAGLSVFVLFAVHTILNWSWVKNVTQSLINLSKTTSAKLKKKYLLNLLLFIGINIITITGILISKVIFDSGAANNLLLINIHKWTAYTCSGLLAIHVALHARYLGRCVKQILLNIHETGIRNTSLRFGAGALIVILVYSRIIFNVTDNSQNKIAQNQSVIIGSTNSQIIKNDSSNNNQAFIDNSQVKENTISLSEFLGNMYCTGCPKHCSLLSPQCGKADPQIQAAKIQYQEIYSEN